MSRSLEFVNGGARGEKRINSLPSKYHIFWMLIFSFTRGERLREEKRTKAGRRGGGWGEGDINSAEG